MAEISSASIDDYACHICPENLDECLEDRLTSENHLLRFEYYVRSFVDHYLSFVTCKICDRWIDKTFVASHAIAHSLIPWSRPKNESEIFFMNFVSKHDDFYYCHLCRLKIPQWYLAISHTDDREHQCRRKERREECNLDGLSLSPDFYELFIGNFIFPGTTDLFQCVVCCCYVGSLFTSIYDHIEDDSHKINEQMLHDEVSQMKKHFSSFRFGSKKSIVDTENKKVTRKEEKVDGNQSTLVKSKMSISMVTNQCVTGEDAEENENVTGQNIQTLKVEDTQNEETVKKANKSDAQENIKTPNAMILLRDLPEGIEYIHDNVYLCTLCNRLLHDEVSVKEHAKVQSHIDSGTKIIFRKDNVRFFCTACNAVIDSFVILRQHLETARHNELSTNLRQYLRKSFVCPPCAPDTDSLPESSTDCVTEIFAETGETSSPAVKDKSERKDLLSLGIERGPFGQLWCKPCNEKIGGRLRRHKRLRSHAVNFTKWKNKLLLAPRAQLKDKNVENEASNGVTSPAISGELAARGQEVLFTQCTICKCSLLNTCSCQLECTEDNHLNGNKADLVNLEKSSKNSSSKKPEREKNYNVSEMNLIQDLFDSPPLDQREDLTRNFEDKYSIKSEENLRVPSAEPKTEEVLSAPLLELETAERSPETSPLKPNKTDVHESTLDNGHQKRKDRDTSETKIANAQSVSDTDGPKLEDSHQKINTAEDGAKEATVDTQKPNGVNSPKINGSDKKFVNNLKDCSEDSLILLAKSNDEVKENKKKKVPTEAIVAIHYKGSAIDSIECKACNMKFLGNYETTAENEYDSHVTTKQHLDSIEKFAENWREVKPAHPATKHFTVVPKMAQTCDMCNATVEDIKKLHTHLAKHFSRRFALDEDSLEEKKIYTIPEEDFKASKVHIESAICEVEGEQVEKSKQLDVLKKTNDSVLQMKNIVKKKLDIVDREKGVKVNLYEINAKRLQDVKLGLTLSCVIDSKKIYCLVCQTNVDSVLQNFYEHLRSMSHMKNLKIMKSDQKKFKKFPGQLSDLALGFESMEEVSDAFIQCHACKVSVKNDCSDLIKHIKYKSHSERWSLLTFHNKQLFDAILSQMEGDFYSTQRYWCVLCDTVFRLEVLFREHLRSSAHMKRVNGYERKKQPLTIDYCAVCATVWFGFSKTFGYHLECKMHKFHTMDRFYMITNLPTSVETLLASPEKQVDEMLKTLDAEMNSAKLININILKDLEECVKERYPEAKAHGFGSRISGLGGTGSDLDIFLDCRARWSSVYGGPGQTSRQIEYRLKQVLKCLENSQDTWHVQGEVLDCRVPIIKAIHRPTEVECDISFSSGLTVENTALIRAYCEKYPNCRKLITFVKNWMSHCNLMGHRGIVSYGVAWLVIYFLQIKSILPTVSQLIEMKNNSRTIAGWETGFSREFEIHSGNEDFTILLIQFFKFYATFDYRNNVMCPLTGENIKKLDFQKLDKLPTDMKPYVSYIDRAENADTLRIDSLMCLQDPFELCHNITKAVKKFTLYKFRRFCSMSAQILQKNCPQLT